MTEDSKIRAKSTPRLALSMPPDVLYKCRESSTNRPCFFKTEPICPGHRMKISPLVTKDYENKRVFGERRSKAKQTQFKPKPMSRWVSFSGLDELGAAVSNWAMSGRSALRLCSGLTANPARLWRQRSECINVLTLPPAVDIFRARSQVSNANIFERGVKK
jgi:hypothetical protein